MKNTILSQKESALLARHFEQAQEAERLLCLAQETDLMAGRTRAKLEACLSALADGEHIVTDANGHQHRIIKVGGQIEDIELVQPVPSITNLRCQSESQCETESQTAKPETMRQIAVVKYQIASYEGTVEVPCDENDEYEVIVAKVKRVLVRRTGELPYGSESFRIQRREYV